MTHSQPGCICVNGCFFEPEEAVVSVFDAGFLLGDGLFESLRAVEGVPYLLDRHLERLFLAAAELEFIDVPPRETLTEQVYRALKRSELMDAYVRITITRGTGAVGLAPPESPPTVVIAVLPAPIDRGVDHAIEVTLLHDRRRYRTAAKSTSWQQSVLARRSVDRRGAEEGLYVASSGHVLEGVASNVFIAGGGRLSTPPVDDCLPGITRARMLELARGAGLQTSEIPLEVEALMAADIVFVTNAVQGPRRVRAVDGIDVGKSDGDDLFDRLHHLYGEDRRAMVGAVL
jgi:branched-subunit amino acid aminotransferase/4-amino-4-deoxychorismate lyase